MSDKISNRKLRLIKLAVLSNAYFHYQMVYLNSQTLKQNNSYEDAEKTSDFINFLINGNSKPSDFLYIEDDISNKIIEEHKKFKIWSNDFNEILGTSEKLIVAFCKSVEHQNKAFLLKLNSFFFPKHIGCFIGYVNGIYTKKQLLDELYEYDIFNSKKKCINVKMLKKTIHQIEDLYNEIFLKQVVRKYKNEI